MSSDATVVFNADCTTYEVSRALVEKFPDSMSAKLISDTWQQDNNDDEAIFLQCNGPRFQYVVDYMQFQKVNLALCVSKEAVLQGLKYFGFFDSATPNEVHGVLEIAEAGHLVKNLFEEQLSDCDEHIKRCQLKKQYLKAIFALFNLKISF